MLKIQDLNLGLQQKKEYFPILTHIHFSLEKGKTLAIVGESGSGKSLTCYSIVKLLPPAARYSKYGHILFEGQDLIDAPEWLMQQLRGRKIAMIFQEPMTALNPVKTIGQQLIETAVIRKKSALYGLLQEVGLDAERVFSSYPHQLSGGMKQRVMIAMALINNPDILIADEPTSALDVTVQAQIMELLCHLQEKRQLSIIFVSHDLNVIRKIAHHVAVMYAGELIEYGEVTEFFNNPRHPYSQQLLTCLPSIEKRHLMLSSIEGAVPIPGEKITGCRFASRCHYTINSCEELHPDFYEIDEKTKVRCLGYSSTLSSSLIPSFSRKQKSNRENDTVGRNRGANEEKKQSELLEILTIKNLTISFNGQKAFTAVDNISFQIPTGKTLALVGESGCGKSTTAKAILKLLPITSGKIFFQQEDISNFRGKKIKEFRKFVQIVFQDPFSSMNPRMLVSDIIGEGLDALDLCQCQHERKKRILKMLEITGLSSTCLNRYPHEFSGGQRQRIAIARALAVEPKLLILDEPTSALDVSVQAQILNLLKELQTEQQISYLLISHNLAAVAYLANDIAVMKSGKLIEVNSTEKIIYQSEHEYTKRLIQASN